MWGAILGALAAGLAVVSWRVTARKLDRLFNDVWYQYSSTRAESILHSLTFFLWSLTAHVVLDSIVPSMVTWIVQSTFLYLALYHLGYAHIHWGVGAVRVLGGGAVAQVLGSLVVVQALESGSAVDWVGHCTDAWQALCLVVWLVLVRDITVLAFE